MKDKILYLLPNVEQFYKANLHTHTNVSDGAHSPEEVKAAYQAKGYSIIAYSDHEICVPHQELTDEEFIALNAYELGINCRCPGRVDFKAYHLCLIAKDPANACHVCYDPNYMYIGNCGNYTDQIEIHSEMRRTYSLECANETIRQANEAGYLVTYNHPNWSLQTREDYIGLRGLWGVEVYNHCCTIDGYEDCDPHVFEELLRSGTMLYPVAADDSHRNPESWFGGWVMVGAEALEYGAVIRALEQGAFYASTGPEIRSLTLQNGILHVKCSLASRISVSTAYRRSFAKLPETEASLTEADIDLHNWYFEPMADAPENAWFRVTVYGMDGTKAYTRAFTREEVADAF